MRKILLPPVLLLLCIIGMAATNYFCTLTPWLETPARYGGFLMIAAGIGLPVWGAMLFKKAQTNIIPYKSPDRMVISGPFNFSRNPMYLGMLLVLLGGATLAGTAESFAFPALYFCVANWWYIPFEEKKMFNVFGNDFISYKKRTRRWI